MAFTRIRTTIVRPADATAYAAGDEVSNSSTAGSVVRMTYNLSGFAQGRILGAALDIQPASSNVVTTALDLEVLVFKTGDAPAAVGDNVTHPLAGNVRALALATFRFDDTGWTGPLGTVAAGTSQFQYVLPTVVQPLATPVLQAPFSEGFPFSLIGVANKSLTIVIRSLAAWTPLAVANTIGLTLDFDLNNVGG